MSGSYREAKACRACGSTSLASIIDLGLQALTGVFPRSKGDKKVGTGPLELVRCTGKDACNLVQLRHSYEPGEMYGDNYGYRSSLNQGMVEHLRAKVLWLAGRAKLAQGNVVLDIGSNDGTTLSFYPGDVTRIGMDPTSAKFAKYYKEGIVRVADFFSAPRFFEASGGKRADIVTSIAMFYDLENPIDFARQVHEVLSDQGLWHFEQSYLPSMLDACSYDTICHEHVEYYALHQIQWIMKHAGFTIVDVSINDVNGGSFAVTVAKSGSSIAASPEVGASFAREDALDLASGEPFVRFAKAVQKHRTELRGLLEEQKHGGKKVFAMGASTKGNVLLQYCGIGPELVHAVSEVNEEKFGCFTPGTLIPIVSEADAEAQKPDVYLVLPWHFREGLLKKCAAMRARGAKFLFPLPRIEIV